jgi:hypothetical protein
MKTTTEEGLRLALDSARDTRPDAAEFMKRRRGIIDSGVPDLASNPEHFAGFGGDAGNRR